MDPFFIGYPTLEAWAEQVGPSRTVNAMPVEQLEPIGHGAIRKRTMAYFSFTADAECHYCRIHLGTTDWIGGTCLNDDQARRDEITSKGWELLEKWCLVHFGHRRREAAVSIPANLAGSLLEGRAEFMVRVKDGWALTSYLRKQWTEIT